MPESPFENIRILLSETEGPVNLGMTARAMANTGFNNLRFSGSLGGDEEDVRRYSLHAYHLIESASKCSSFEELIQGSDVLIALTPRNPWNDGHSIGIDEFPHIVYRCTQKGQTVGLLFGNEATGLLNDEVAICRYRLPLPSSKDYESLNLAQAVLVVLWELRRKLTDRINIDSTEQKLAGGDEKRVFLNKLRTLLLESEYLDGQNPEMRWREINLIFESRDFTEREMSLLTSFTNKVLKEHRAAKKD
ncbi:RNA methyltransferase [Limisalsivibrio acetivorans]|uniref:RNA methyltransferase n=1 Tax=Limisalsivibrio acetivorans TaxID=1304888 RepID=UPI0003B7A83D|nr:RNA methyltransferase [Limisalsivibrio acetivorans]